MKITLELPDWCDERHIYIFAGIELAAVKIYGEDHFKVKEGRCNQCGECCVDSQWTACFDKEKGYCEHLEILGEERRCKLGTMRPFSCSTGDPMTLPEGPWVKCCITYKQVR
jgi:hypothetical protein